jgi:hypothetical protein
LAFFLFPQIPAFFAGGGQFGGKKGVFGGQNLTK